MGHVPAVSGLTVGLAIIAWGLFSKRPYGGLGATQMQWARRVWVQRVAYISSGLFCIAVSWNALYGAWGWRDALGVFVGLIASGVAWRLNKFFNQPETGVFRERSIQGR